MKNKLIRQVWEKEAYYNLAKQGSLDVNHRGMKVLNKLSKDKHSILDLGCGEGTRLNHFYKKGRNLIGIDISKTAIKRATRQYSRCKFVLGDLERLPFKKETFDLVYSAFVLEHTDKPEKIIKEGVRVLKKGGFLVLIAPNFGAPNMISPPFKGSRVKKLINGYFKDLSLPFSGGQTLTWEKVKPLADSKNYQMDWDTTVEPYLGSLIPFIDNLNLQVIETSSCWEEMAKDAKIHQKIFKFLGDMNIYPFINWGPHLVLAAKK